MLLQFVLFIATLHGLFYFIFFKATGHKSSSKKLISDIILVFYNLTLDVKM